MAQKLNPDQIAVFEAIEFHRPIPRRLNKTLSGMVRRGWVRPLDSKDAFLATTFALTPEGRQAMMAWIRENLPK